MSPRSVNRITYLLLLLGFGSAIVLYLIAPPPPDESGFDDPLTNKKYVHELKVLGGRANVLAAEFEDWFAAQWHGVALARTVLVLTIGATLVFRFAATPPEPAGTSTTEEAGPPDPPA